MSILGGFLPPVHGTVYRQAQPQVTLSLPTRVQVNGSGAVLSPSSVAIPQASSSQGMPFESVLPPSLFGDTSRKGCRRGFSSFLNSSSCPAHYSCILSVDRGGCLHAHLQAPRCPPLPHLPPVDQTPPVPPLLLRAWLHPWFSSVANAGDRCSSAITIRDARSVIPVCRVAGRCLCI